MEWQSPSGRRWYGRTLEDPEGTGVGEAVDPAAEAAAGRGGPRCSAGQRSRTISTAAMHLRRKRLKRRIWLLKAGRAQGGSSPGSRRRRRGRCGWGCWKQRASTTPCITLPSPPASPATSAADPGTIARVSIKMIELGIGLGGVAFVIDRFSFPTKPRLPPSFMSFFHCWCFYLFIRNWW